MSAFYNKYIHRNVYVIYGAIYEVPMCLHGWAFVEGDFNGIFEQNKGENITEKQSFAPLNTHHDKTLIFIYICKRRSLTTSLHGNLKFFPQQYLLLEFNIRLTLTPLTLYI